jgi:hypothetical protein
MRLRKNLLVALGAVSLAVPAAALADPGHGHGHGNGHVPAVQYVFKGTYAGAGVVTVDKGNRHVRRAELVDTPVTFDLAGAKLEVADTNLDTLVDANDLVTDDVVLVQARLPKGDPGSQPFPARKVVDKTHPADSGDDTDDGDTGDTT